MVACHGSEAPLTSEVRLTPCLPCECVCAGRAQPQCASGTGAVPLTLYYPLCRKLTPCIWRCGAGRAQPQRGGGAGSLHLRAQAHDHCHLQPGLQVGHLPLPGALPFASVFLLSLRMQCKEPVRLLLPCQLGSPAACFNRGRLIPCDGKHFLHSLPAGLMAPPPCCCSPRGQLNLIP